MSAVQELERKALALALADRAHLAETLLDSLPTDENLWSDAEELAEVERRDTELESGAVRPLSEDEFWTRIQARSKA